MSDLGSQSPASKSTDLHTQKLFQGIAIPYSALVSVIFGLMIFSFPIGTYVFFNSQIGKSIDYSYPISETLSWELGESFSTVGIGDVFVGAWTLFLILFTISIFGPKKNFLGVLSPLMGGLRQSQDGNYLIHTIKWFSIIIVLSEAIAAIQELFGIKTAMPPFENELVHLLSVTYAPIIEEVGFRVILVGIPLFLLYSQKASIKKFFMTLWNPSANLPVSGPKAVIVIIIAGVLFGALHLTEQWGEGKFAQAAMSGIILGWVYYRYGFVSAILIHWATNYVIFSYGYLVSSINETNIADAFSHSLLLTIEILFTVTGVLAIVLLILNKRQKITEPV